MKSIIVICFVMFSVFTVDGQVTEHFSDETPGATSFSNSGVTYNLTGGKFEIAYGSAYGYTGTTTDDYYVDNWSSILNAAGVVGTITKTTNNFYVYDFWIFPGDGSVTKSNGGTIIIRGKLSGATQFTKTVEGADINLGVGYTYVDLTSFSTTEIDELEFELTGNLRYLAVDAFRHQSVAANATPTATAPSAPSVTEDDTNVALADDIQVADTDGDDQTVTFTITGGTLTIGTAGSITFPSGSNGTSSFSAAGNLSDINAALDAATFTPTPNLNGTNAGTISFTTNDGTVSSSATSVSFNITAVNDDPTISGLPTDITVSEDIASNVDLSAATLSDVDAGSNSIVLTIEASAGTLTAGSGGSVTIGGSGTATLSLTGSVANIDTYLNTSSNIKYTSASNVNGSDAATLTLTANDGGYTGSSGGENVALGTVNVDITAVNDKPTASSFTTSTIYENTTYAFVTANFGYSDDDGDPLDHVRITAVPANGSLWVDADGSGTINGAESALSNNGTVSKADLDAGKLKYLNTNGTSSSFTFDVSDGTDYSTSTYTATLTVTPEPTVTLSLDPSSSISENAGSTSVKATLSNTFNKTVSVNLLKSGTTSGTDYSLSSTSISITTGNTTGTATITGVNDDLDDDNETVIIDISSVTNGTESGTQQVICTLTDDDNTPVVTASQSFSIAENIANSGAVGTVLATDGDAGTSFSSWTETGGTGASIFEINASSGAITVTDNSGIDYETTTSYTYAVTVSDGTNTSASEMITINITDVNDVAPVVTATQSFSIAENTADSGAVGTVLATDGDAGTSFSAWTETGGTGASIFEINASSGAITVTDNSGIDYETTTSYTYTVTVSDGTNTSASETITINITDVNDVAPIVTASQTFNIDEDASNTTSVGTVLATDGDATATTFSSWTITAGNTNSVFAINSSTGEITVNDANELDYESITSYSLSITVSDGVNTSAAETVTVNVNAINDNTPVVTASQSFGIAENIANSGAVGTVLATDGDAGTSFSAWTETGGTGASIFEINASTGAITVTDNSGIDYETTTSYTYTVTVSDGTNTSATETITINIIDINDNTPVVTSTQSFSIAENTADSGAVGTVLATDGDAGTSFSAWTETGGTGASIFEINASSGAITVTDNSGIDYETTTSYTYTVTVSDGTNTSASETITINITDVNDVAPIVTASQTFNIDEDASNTTSVGTVSATDSDATATIFSSWTITAGNTNSVFAINSSTGEITVNDANELDYESITSYSLSITVSDGVNTSVTETVTVDVNAINDNTPVVTAYQSFGIAENIANSGAVGTVLATDGDAGTSFSAWTETGGTGASIFEINASSGAITVTDNSGIDYETTTSYTYTVTVSDGINTSASETIIINITDVNDVDPVVTASQSFSIAENIANSGAVGTVLATDGDAGTSFSAWTETGGTGASIFEINASSGTITVTDNSGIDYETTTSYTYTVTVSDGINTSTAETITINITDVNDVAPIVTASQTFNIDEDASNTTSVGTVLATDSDATATTFSSWTITAGNTNSVFAINSSTGEITVNDANELDYESITSYSLSITVSDGVNTSVTETVTVDVNDINDEIPVFTSASAINIDENTTDVITLTATDGDVGTTFTFNKIGGADQALFTINSSTGALAFTSAPDYETPLDINADNDYIVQVSVSDGLNSSTQTITVSVDNVTGITITSNGGGATAGISIPENSTSIAAVTSVNEGVAVPSYSLVGGADQAKFNIHPTSGVLTLLSAPDYESPQDAGGNNSYEVIVRVTGDGGATDDQTITVTITDVNDITPVVTASQSFSIAENTANSGAVGTVLATDGDAGTSFSAWTETGGTGASIFEINASSGAITVTDNSGIDYETTTSYTYIVTVSDGTNTSASEMITINITDVNDVAPVVTATQSFSIAENTANSGAVGTVLATDGDAGTSFSAWTETGGTGASIFEINASSGAITVTDNSGIDYETTTSYTYTVTVSDGINTSTAETITINITDVNDVAPIVTASQTFNIDEDASNTTSVGTVLATDGDATATTFSSWTITAGNTNSVFAINSSTGEITVNDANELDYESITSYSLSITVSDGVNTSVTETVTVDVNAINDNTPVVTASQSFDIAENTANSGAVGTVLATDGDAGTSFSSWTETGGSGASIFEINASSGAITVTDNSGIDYETTTSYTYTVTVSDGINTSASETIIINITDINDVDPVVTASQSFSIAENTANSGAVGTVLATDGDAGTSFSAWTETGGTGASIFEINASSGAITVTDNSGIDYETTTSYTYAVTVSDGTNTSASETITINITDVNDVAPIVTASQTFNIDEDASNTTSVGTVLATDSDATATTFSSWTITAGNTDGIFAVNSTTGEITVTDNTNLDYETTTSYSLTVTVSDGTHTSSEEIVIININDSNENAPTAIQLSNTTIAENSAIGTEVGILTASDADIDETFTFNLAENEYFELDGDRIVSKEIFNYEDYISYSLKVTVTDQGGLSYNDRFTINIENQNETPEFLSEPVVQATVGDMYVYNMEYEDVDEDGCIISVIEKPDWLSVEDHGNGSCTLSGIPTEIGNFNVILEASDDEFSVKQEFEITVETVTGIDDVPKKLSVRVYPNPVIHELHIDLSDFRNDETTISLFSMTGSLIFKEEHKNIGGEVRIIKSVEQLRSGAYFLVIESEGYRKSYKIVKQ
ncbi:cadherin domain-containing protein [Labilibaculum euxinus]